MNYPSSQTLELYDGWNLISSYLNSTQSLEEIFNPIQENIVIVKNNFGSAYLPEWNFNGIGDFNSLEGYFIKTNISTSLNINGAFLLPEENPIYLNSGWSTISYLRTDQVSADLIFNEIVNDNNLVSQKHLGKPIFLSGILMVLET